MPAVERDPLRGTEPGRGCEQDHRPVALPKRGRDRFNLDPGLKGTLLLAPRSRVVDADLGGIDVDHPPIPPLC
jgi:hypothetical protein